MSSQVQIADVHPAILRAFERGQSANERRQDAAQEREQERLNRKEEDKERRILAAQLRAKRFAKNKLPGIVQELTATGVYAWYEYPKSLSGSWDPETIPVWQYYDTLRQEAIAMGLSAKMLYHDFKTSFKRGVHITWVHLKDPTPSEEAKKTDPFPEL